MVLLKRSIRSSRQNNNTLDWFYFVYFVSCPILCTIILTKKSVWLIWTMKHLISFLMFSKTLSHPIFPNTKKSWSSTTKNDMQVDIYVVNVDISPNVVLVMCLLLSIWTLTGYIIVCVIFAKQHIPILSNAMSVREQWLLIMVWEIKNLPSGSDRLCMSMHSSLIVNTLVV